MNKSSKSKFTCRWCNGGFTTRSIMTSHELNCLSNLANKSKAVPKSSSEEVEEAATPAAASVALQPPTDNINLCFVGGVSTGKSTLLNAIFCEELTQCKIKRTTMVPTIYIENPADSENITPSSEIFAQIVDKNTELIAKTESGQSPFKEEYSELAFNVGKLDINILPDAFVNVYDIPGLNDARTKTIYYDYLAANFHKFNLVVLLVDIHSGLNTSDEIDIVQFVANHIKEQREKFHRNVYTAVVVNKADDMQLGDDGNLTLTGELSEMYEQVERTLHSEFERKDISDNLIGIVPLCALDAYLYRMVQKRGRSFQLSPEQILKIGVNENGKKFSLLKPAVQESKVYEILENGEIIQTMIELSGFASVEKTLREFLSRDNTGNKMRVQNLLQELGNLPDMQAYMRTTKPDVWDRTVFDQTFAVLERIKQVDEDQYNEIMASKTGDVVREFLGHVESCKKFSLVETFWSNFKTYFSATLANFFDFSKVPHFVKSHVVFLTDGFVSTTYVLSVQNVCEVFAKLKEFEAFDKATVEDTMYKIMARMDTANNSKQIADETTEKDDFKPLIEILQDIRALGVSPVLMKRFVRFLIMYRIIVQGHDAWSLMKRQLFYHLNDEMLMYNWLLTKTSKHNYAGMEDLFVDGLREKELAAEEYLLDVFYVKLMEEESV